MSSLINYVQLIGRTGKDIELKQSSNGTYYAAAPLATSEFFQGKEGKVEETYWHKLVVFGKNAETMAAIVKKGDKIMVQGRLVHKSYTDSKGILRFKSEIVVKNFMLLSANRSTSRKVALTA